MKKLKAILFDFDGTLVDTAKGHFDTNVSTLKALNIDPEIIKVFDFSLYNKIFAPHNDRDGFIEFVKYFNIKNFDLDKACIIKSKKYSKILFNSSESVYPGVHNLINNLLNSNILMAIVTGSLKNEVIQVLKSISLISHITTIVSTADPNIKSKPYPDSYIKAAEILKIPIEYCICIEDTPKGALSSINARAKVICVTHTNSEDVFNDLKEKFSSKILIVEKIGDLSINIMESFLNS